jgi:hypothetical protein
MYTFNKSCNFYRHGCPAIVDMVYSSVWKVLFISIVYNIANFKIPLIDGAETVSTVPNLKFDVGNYR